MPLREFLDEVASPGADAGGRVLRARSRWRWPPAWWRWRPAPRGAVAGGQGRRRAGGRLRERVAPLAQRTWRPTPRRSRACAEAVTEVPGAKDLGVVLERAARIPLEIAEAAVDVASLAAWWPNAASRPCAPTPSPGALLAQGAARAAATLVEVNLATTGPTSGSRAPATWPGRRPPPRTRARDARLSPEGRKPAAPPSGGRNDRDRHSQGTQNGLPELDTEPET